MRSRNNAKLCSHKSKTTGKPCRGFAVKGTDSCRMHGGTATGRPIETGRYSKRLPTRLAAGYEEAFRDTDLLSLRGQFAFLDALLVERMAKLGDATSAELWRAAQDAFAEFQSLWRRSLKKDGDAILQLPGAINAMGEILVNGLGQQKAEADARNLIQEQIVVARQEVARLEKMGQFMTSQQVMGLLASVIATVREYVTDPRALAAISKELGVLSLRDSSASA